MPNYDNKLIYSTVEFDKWANIEGMYRAEKYLIDRYFNKDGKTLEGGTGGGRLLFGMKEMGFTSLHGFDFVPELIESAKGKDIKNEISFDVQDATNLKYQNSSFDQIIYVGQIICFIDNYELREKAVSEAYRVLKPGGVGLFSFLCYDIRSKSWLTPYLMYVMALRKLTGSNRTKQSIPWLKLGGKPNYKSIADQGPYVYWYRIKEADQFLKNVGFKIVAMGTTKQIYEGKMYDSCESLSSSQIDGTLYFVCTK